jgi:hypothetical protein
MTIRTLRALALAFALEPAVVTVAHAEPPAPVQREINMLLAYIGNSGCEFKRNDIWSTAAAAEAHVRGKYNILATLGRINTTADFIDKAAAKSNLSGQPYEVRCSNAVPMPSNVWLNIELAHTRLLTR